jgi:uncharacterized protein (TIGR02246 family)
MAVARAARTAVLLWILLWGWLALAAPAGADPVREAVEAGNRAFAEAFGRGDAPAVAALYTEDALLVPPGSPLVRGRSAIAAFWQGSIDAGTTAVTLETAEVEAAGGLAVEIGTARLVAKDGAIAEARYLVVWKQLGGRWYLHRDIWNTEK